ncbi:MAG: methyl-accepting chemotaxis protein [Spirochaetaceae bacterium]|nr:methyl-accepting chemotaxis protein [Spirochaetaceae bacterium]
MPTIEQKSDAVAFPKQSLITVDQSKCNGCHSCITACPIKSCIDASGDTVTVVDDLCIGCGRCIPACKQEARSYSDDTDKFFYDLKEGKKIVAIVAPAAAAVFKNILKLNGYLKHIGVKAVFDVSFGAELTVKSYLDYAKNNKPRLIIAQPCASIVSYCEIYKPQLLKYLAPAQSPMLHTAIMIKKFFPEYANCKIAAISPCAAKKREFKAVPVIEYNVTMSRLKEKMELAKQGLSAFPEVEYEGPLAERAVLFSSPGGLRETIAREAPEMVPKIRKIEGPEVVYKYLNELPESLEKNKAPFVVDCLNCEAGCNGGPGTGNYGKSIDILENLVSERAENHIQKNKKSFLGRDLKRALKKYWRKDIYSRTYKDLSERTERVKTPSDKELQGIFKEMKKNSQKDILNCSCCGYGSCRSMAEMIYNGLNKKEHCLYFIMAKLSEDEKIRSMAVTATGSLVKQLEDSKETLVSMQEKVSKYIDSSTAQGKVIDKSSGKMSNLIVKVQETSRETEKKREALEHLGRTTEAAKKDMKALLDAFSSLQNGTQEIAGIAGVIKGIAASTNLLAMNAAIEAAHAGESGKGFSVVAGEIRSLAGATSENANNISANIKNIVKQIGSSTDFLNKMDGVMARMVGGVNNVEKSFTEIIQAHAQVTNSTRELTGDLESLNETSANLRESSKDIIEALDTIRALIASLDNATDSAKIEAH